ncbi:MAG: HDOD domain-containing protein [Burkholderiaceae bacterium]|nr:HDOD domain-containing protein [Burkholderiaceae bacterium]
MSGRETLAEHGSTFKSVAIPPRPALFLALQRELRKEDKDVRRIAELVNRDVAMAAKLLEATNSAFFGLHRQVSSVTEAIQLIGTDHCAAVMSGLIVKNALGVGISMMARFWDVSEKRARGMSFLARETRIAEPQLAYSFGLFCDIGIPLMKAAFPRYLETLAIANQHGALEFLAVETERHGVDHASVGAMLAGRWALDDEVVAAIALHHDYEKLYDESVPGTTRALIALNGLVEKAIQQFRGDQSHEWDEGGQVATEALALSGDEVDELCQGLAEKFHG